jgi:ATP-dependent helicase IRC3
MWVWRARIPSPQISNVRWNRTNSSILLRPYQEACIQSCLDAIQHGHTRIGVSSPTGSGKTTMFVSLIARLQPPEGKSDATRSLVIVNSVELVRQTAESVRRLFPNLTIEVEQGSKNNASGLADITVATYQTLLRPHRLDKFHPERMKAVIVDEAHHAAAPSYVSFDNLGFCMTDRTIVKDIDEYSLISIPPSNPTNPLKPRPLLRAGCRS